MNDFESQWELVRSKGKLRFILIQGLLLWGVPMAFVMFAYLHWFKDQPTDLILKITVPVFLIGGLIWGNLVWFFLDRKYQRLNK